MNHAFLSSIIIFVIHHKSSDKHTSLALEFLNLDYKKHTYFKNKILSSKTQFQLWLFQIYYSITKQYLNIIWTTSFPIKFVTFSGKIQSMPMVQTRIKIYQTCFEHRPKNIEYILNRVTFFTIVIIQRQPFLLVGPSNLLCILSPPHKNEVPIKTNIDLQNYF